MKKYYDFNEIVKSFMPLKEIQPTHCMDLLLAARKGLKDRKVETIQTNYTANGITSLIKDVDGQMYELSIKATKK